MKVKYITIKVDRNTIRKIFITDILYIKAEGAYSKIKLVSEQTFLVSRLLKTFSFLTENFNFYRAKRSFIINIDNIIELKKGKKNYITLVNTEKIEIMPKDFSYLKNYMVSLDETMEFNITDNNGEINFNEVANIFNSLKTKTAELKKKARYISAIDVDEVGGTISYNISKQNIEKSTELFNIWGDWIWGEELGECNGNNVGSDALLRIRGSITQSELIFPVGTWWSNNDSKGLKSDDYLNPNDIPTTLDNHRDYLLFYRRYTISNFSTCINNSDVNWYKNNLWSLMNSEIPSGYKPYTFINYPDTPYYYINTTSSPYNGILWNIRFKYGIKHYSGNNGM